MNRPAKKPDLEWDFGESQDLAINPGPAGQLVVGPKQPPSSTRVVRRAWEITQGEDHPAPTWLGAWLVECPKLHMYWSYWIVTLVHLRDCDGVAPAIITRPGSTHELQVLAVDPNSPMNPDSFQSLQYMMPPDVVEQFGPATDAEALFVLHNLVNACVRAALHPDCDFRKLWAPAIAEYAQAAQVTG